MAKYMTVKIPVICKNTQCSNFGNLVNKITLSTDNIDLFYESYDGTEQKDYCPICKELGVAEDYKLVY